MRDIVEGPRIRDATSDDAAATRAIYAPIVASSAISFEEEPPTVEEMARRIGSSHVWLVCELNDELVGYAYAAKFHPRAAYRWSVEVSIYFGHDARGRGLGKLLLTALLDRLRRRGFVNAFAGTTLPNDRSIRLFESLGFRKIGHHTDVGFKLGAWHDVGWWQLNLQEASVPPPSLFTLKQEVTSDASIVDLSQ